MGCCEKANGSNTNGNNVKEKSSSTYEHVQDYYGKILATSKDLKTSACTASGRPHSKIIDLMRKIPVEVMDKFYGCGAPLPLGVDGLKVLDLGSGSGRDAYVCAALVGEQGSVVGIDMTQEQIQVSRDHADAYCQELKYRKPNMRFVEGHIEYLDQAGIADESVNIIISNCVVNLSPDKRRVLQEAYRVLAKGGEFYFSDVYCDRRLPQHVKDNQILWGECISGALYNEDFKRLAREAGFADPRVLSSSRIDITDAQLAQVVGNAAFSSITYRLFKLPHHLESLCEDYGQVATYKGSIKGYEHSYQLDDHHAFQTGKPMLVCGNTAAMVGEDGISWLSKHFQVSGDRSVHYGLFQCVTGPQALQAAPQSQSADSCGAGGCC
ncbi:hypothetical protein ABBQ38_003245 [Trebouxia sp. C0009 RCD-2024]